MNKIELYKKLSKVSIDSIELLELRKEVSEGKKDPCILVTPKYLDIVHRYDISEIVNNIEIFDEDELLYIKDLLRYSATEKNMVYRNIMDLSIPSDLSEEELRIMLSKYNITELLLLSDVLVYVHDEDLDLLYRVYNEVFNSKTKKDIKELDRFLDEERSIVDVLKKNDELNNKEINYFYKLVSNARDFLSSIDEEEYGVNNENFDINDYPIVEIQYMEKVLADDIENRKENIITKKLKH